MISPHSWIIKTVCCSFPIVCMLWSARLKSLFKGYSRRGAALTYLKNLLMQRRPIVRDWNLILTTQCSVKKRTGRFSKQEKWEKFKFIHNLFLVDDLNPFWALSFSLFVCLLSVCLSLSVCLAVCLSIYLSIYLSIHFYSVLCGDCLLLVTFIVLFIFVFEGFVTCWSFPSLHQEVVNAVIQGVLKVTPL